LRFTLQGQRLVFSDEFITHAINDCGASPNDLHRPEGLVFGPDGRLYVTSFRASAADTDKVLLFSGRTQTSKIDLDQVGQDRAFAQALLFGPGGKLFVPISNTGEVRRYDVTGRAAGAAPFETFIKPGGALKAPEYLTFDRTDPATLAFR
jgi:sugar lactone lactonase YvrE